MSARTPEECDDLFARRIGEGDVDGVVALYEERGCLVMEGGKPSVGKAEIRKAIETFAALKPRLSMSVTRVVRAGDDLAVLYNDWTLTATGPDGKPIHDSGKALEIVRRQSDGTWLFVVDDPRARG
jgi:uncharacterized protein (TIGR02246 family)